MADLLACIGNKWSVPIVMLLSGGSKRFNEMRRLVDGISHRMLTLTLRGLERDGLVSRTVFATVPPRVDYQLTPLGESLLMPLSSLGKWAISNRHAIETARQHFDDRPLRGEAATRSLGLRA